MEYAKSIRNLEIECWVEKKARIKTEISQLQQQMRADRSMWNSKNLTRAATLDDSLKHVDEKLAELEEDEGIGSATAGPKMGSASRMEGGREAGIEQSTRKEFGREVSRGCAKHIIVSSFTNRHMEKANITSDASIQRKRGHHQAFVTEEGEEATVISGKDDRSGSVSNELTCEGQSRSKVPKTSTIETKTSNDLTTQVKQVDKPSDPEARLKLNALESELLIWEGLANEFLDKPPRNQYEKIKEYSGLAEAIHSQVIKPLDKLRSGNERVMRREKLIADAGVVVGRLDSEVGGYHVWKPREDEDEYE